MRHNGERRPEEIQAEIARTRGDMDATLTAIEQRLTPGQLVDQGLDYLRNSGANEFVHNLGGSVKNNPLPVALMGIGIAWLMATGNRKPAYLHAEKASSGPGMMQRASEGMSSAKDRAAQSVQGARERVGQLGQTARNQMERVRDQPLVLGAIGLAIGAVVAAGLPRTREEDQLMGEASDRLTEKAKEVGKEQMGKVQQVASAAATGRPNVIEPARASPLGESGVIPKDPRLGTP